MAMTEQIQTTDVVIVGAGMVGLCAALAIARSGLQVTVIEGRSEAHLAAKLQQKPESDKLHQYDNRVSALTRASENIFRNLNAWQSISEYRVCGYTDMRVWDGQGSASIDFSCTQLYQDNLGHIVENSVVVAALLAQCKAQGIKLCCDTQVQAMAEIDESSADNSEQTYNQLVTCQQKNNTEAESAKEQLLKFKTKLVVGADGALSKVRQLATIELYQRDYQHHAIVATVRTTEQNQRTAWQCFTSDGPLAFLPLSNPNLSSIVWSTSADNAKSLMQMSDDEFAKALALNFESRLGEVCEVSTRAVFPLSERRAKDYVKKGVVLIGDAAHTIHPLAGQGVNLGLLDAAELGDVLQLALKRAENIGDITVLKRFERARYSENLKMALAMQGFKTLFDMNNAPVTIARNIGMRLFDRITPVKQHVISEAMGLSGKLPSLANAIS